MLIWQGKPLCDTSHSLSLAFLPMDAPVLADASTPPIFLGMQGDAPRFCHVVDKWQPPEVEAGARTAFLDSVQDQHPALPQELKFIDLRAAMSDLSPAEAGDAATAKGILGWHESHPFCARCGQPSEVAQGGWQRSCPACGAQHFPRTDPVVIVLVTRGDELLLGRSPHWPTGMFSLLAGFMEPGESVGDAARREVFEETGIIIGNVDFIASQPWPFPSSLMMGCRAEALNYDITLDENELEVAQWVSRENIAASLRGENPDLLPARKGAIARVLLEWWLANG